MQKNVRVSWVPAANAPAAISQFRVWYSLNNPEGPYDTLAAVANGDQTQADVLNLSPGTYNFAVSEVDVFSQEGSKSGGSNAIVVASVPAPPGAPTNVGAVFI